MENNLDKRSIIYVTRDIERAIGFDLTNPHYFIISNSSQFAKQVTNNSNNILLIEGKKQLDTWELLTNDMVKDFISKIANPQILVFKNTKQIEQICELNHWKLLNPSAELASTIEQKISQVAWLADANKYLPEAKIQTCKNINFKNEKFILQFNQSHTGSGTILIESKEQLEEIKNKFPKREARITKFVDGLLLTNNNIVTKDKIILGNISYQITGLEPFTNNKFSTIGNDWGLAHKILTQKQLDKYKKIVDVVGRKMQTEGWLGLFGVDIILEKNSDNLYLIEINARQPASTTFESQLQTKNKKDGEEITTFEGHLLAILGEKIVEKKLIEITDGSQIILRKTDQISEKNLLEIKSNLEKENFQVIMYDNKKDNSDLLRIQSTKSIMKEHEKFNDNGLKIINILTIEQPDNLQPFQKTIEHYLNLSIADKKIQTPYFNNRRSQLRGALGVLVGKGNPEELEDESQIISLKEKINLPSLSEEKIKEFMIDNNLGIDCSGFVYYILDALVQEKLNKKLNKVIKFPFAKSLIRKIICKLRPAQNFSVRNISHESNTKEIALENIQTGDLIIFLASGPKQDYNHIMFVESVDYTNNGPQTIHYIHAYKWPSDGKYNHGVRRGKIEIVDLKKNILGQSWSEQNKTKEENWTFVQAKSAKEIFVRRLKALSS